MNIPFMTEAGAAVFENLALLFAIGIAVGLAHDNNGIAGLAGAVGYFVVDKGCKNNQSGLEYERTGGNSQRFGCRSNL